VNIISAVILAVSSWRKTIKSYFAHHKIDNRRPSLIKEFDLRRQLLQSIASIMLVLSLLSLSAGLVGHMVVLLENNGMMPISEEYLLDVEDPVVVEGIRNDALYFKRIIDSETALPQLGQTIRAERLSFLLPDGFVYLSPTELVIALALMSTITFSMVTDTLRRSRRLRDRYSPKTPDDDQNEESEA
ncbi:MAG: hypothetical protein GX028_06590, partial [Clostridiaceae bacterium]|nr:hypothetical protein [Clostridiaceae bacterium]